MKKTVEVIEPRRLTLGDMIGNRAMMGDIEIVNECNETLLSLAYAEDNVCPFGKTLSKELLNRTVLSFGTRDGRTMFKVEGVEDAD